MTELEQEAANLYSAPFEDEGEWDQIGDERIRAQWLAAARVTLALRQDLQRTKEQLAKVLLSCRCNSQQ